MYNFHFFFGKKFNSKKFLILYNHFFIEWGASFFDVGVSLKNCSCRLKRTKLCGSFGPKADKLLAGLEQILPYKKALWRQCPSESIVCFKVEGFAWLCYSW